MEPRQNPSNPFATKFTCRFRLKREVSKLQATLALAKLINVEVAAALYLMKQTHQLSFLDCECFRTVHLTQEETETVKSQLEPYFNLDFSSADVCTIAFGNVIPWKPTLVHDLHRFCYPKHGTTP